MNDLKAGLSRYVAEARSGLVVEITSHEKPVARLVGIPATGSAGVTRLVARGAAQWSAGKPLWQPPVLLAPGGTRLSQMVLEDRAG